MTQPTTLDRRTFLQLVGSAAVVGCAAPTDPDAGRDAPGADVPGADVPGADVPGADVPGSDVPGTDAGPGADPRDWDARYAAALGPLDGALWVATDGDDASPGSAERPFRTLARGVAALAPGGQLIVRDGTYDGPENWINAQSATPPSGTSAQRTRVRAEHRFGVRLTQRERPSGYEQCPILLPPGSRHVWIDGFVVDVSWESGTGDDNAAFAVVNAGRDNVLTRLMVRRSSVSRYGGSFAYGDSAVLEDCHAIGSGRYVFYGGAGGDSVPAGTSVLRRCTSTMSFGPAREPTASFCFYGSNDGDYDQCRDVLFANCYEVDSPYFGRSDDARKWGSWYLPKSVRNVAAIGCGSLSSGAGYAAFRTDNYGPADALLARFVDCFVHDLAHGSPAGVAAFGKADNGRVLAEHCTTGALTGPPLDGGVDETAGLHTGAVHVVQRSGDLGAEQRFAVGRFLSAHGEEGYDVPQPDLPLWPFPYEAELARLTAEPVPRPANDLPADVTTSADPYAGVAMDGSPRHLTKRIWEAVGHPMPTLDEIYPR